MHDNTDWHGITIKVFENSESIQAKRDLFCNKKLTSDPINSATETKKTPLQILSDENKINIKGSNIAGTSYSVMENKNGKKKIYVSNFHWQKLKKRGKSYGPLNKQRFNESNQECTSPVRRSYKRLDQNMPTPEFKDSLESTVCVGATSNLPGLNKNLFLNDELMTNKINKQRGREDRSILPGFNNTNKSESRKYDDSEYTAQSLKAALRPNEQYDIVSKNGLSYNAFLNPGILAFTVANKLVKNTKNLSNQISYRLIYSKSR